MLQLRTMLQVELAFATLCTVCIPANYTWRFNAIPVTLSLYHFLQAYQQYSSPQEESLLEQVAAAP